MNKFSVIFALAAIAVLASGVALAVAGALPSLDAPERPTVSVAPQQSADPPPKPTATPYVKQEESPSISIGGVSDSRIDEKITGKEESTAESKDSAGKIVEATPTPSLSVLRGAPGWGSGGASETESVEGTVYTWQDGDREMRSVLQNDATDPQDRSTSDGEQGIAVKGVRSSGKVSGDVDDKVLPEFRMESGGGLMTLPGGVLLLLNPKWDEARVSEFFTSNDISPNDVKELEFQDNGFLVNTEAGFPSLTLANQLAGKEGVISSSPNWSRERQAK